MATDTTVNNLIINKLTKAQYEAIVSPSDTELYLVPDEIDSTPTSGSDNPVKSGGVYTALGNKQDTLVSGTNIKTINNESLLGSGNIDIQGSGSGSGEDNVIEVVKVNGTALTPDGNKAVDVSVPTKVSDLTNDSGFLTGMTILSYGSSTWNDFITAYNAKKVVYCRASQNSNPASGSQTRLAFMAYVNNASTPTEVEFQYYRSIGTHSASQQGDQVFVYKLTSGGTWTVTTREATTKIVASTGLQQSYSNGTLTVSLGASIPSKTSDLTNDSGFISSETDPTVPSWAKASSKPTYTASEVGALPDDTSIPDSLSDLSEDTTHRTVTDTEKSTWNSKGTYSKPSGGIPKTDLDSSVQNSLGLADTALQSESDPVFSVSAASGITSSDITNWNSKTSNVGTITGITMNGASKGTSGVVDLGTVITAHQDISGKADKSTTTTAGTYKSVTVNTDGIVTGGTNPTTLAGYGITDAYTKDESNSHFCSLDRDSSSVNVINATSGAPVDLNDYKNPGTYVNSDLNTYQYVSNLPSDFTSVHMISSKPTFRLYVFKEYSSNYFRQRIQNTRARYCNAWERIYNGSSWESWYPVQDDLTYKPNIYTGSSAPSSGTGSNGDIYIQIS